MSARPGLARDQGKPAGGSKSLSMGTLYLVRHGQASFGADDYDVLSPLGHRQSVRLGEYFKARGLRFEAALSGTLNRQRQTLAGICEGLGVALEPGAPAPALADGGALPHRLWPGLNEYDSAALIAAVHPHPLARPDTPELYRHHFRLLKDGLAQWITGAASPQGMPDHAGFVAGVTGALDHVRAHHQGAVLLVSSGGPIATAVGHVLGTRPEAMVELNLAIRNCSVTEFTFSPRRHRLVSFNTLPHLQASDHAGWVTYA